MLSIEVANRQRSLTISAPRLQQAIERVLSDAGIAEAIVSLALVDDAEIYQLNRQFLDHDEPTDVLSFVLERHGDYLEGEIIASADTAVRAAPAWGWRAEDELLLYVIHGALHLVGYDDLEDEARAAMREQERRYLADYGLEHHSADTSGTNPPPHAG